MTKQECCELLGAKCVGDPGEEATVESLTDAIERSIEFRLIEATEDLKGFTIVQVLSETSIFLKNGEKLLFLEIVGLDFKYFEASIDANKLLKILRTWKLLHEAVCQPIADELDRLVKIKVADRHAREEESWRSYYDDTDREDEEYELVLLEKLKLKYEHSPALTTATTDPIVVAGVSIERADA